MGDVVFHVPDKSMENGFRAFFQRPDWAHVLDCAPFEIDPTSREDIFRIPRYKDGGVWKYAAINLGNHLGRYSHAIVLLDEDFDPYPGAARIRSDIETNMRNAGWPPDRFAVIVIEPMLEAWLWTDDETTAAAFGVVSYASLRDQLIQENLWTHGQPKPSHLKDASERAVAIGGRIMMNVLVQTVFAQLSKPALDQCAEPGFNSLRETLRTWFPPAPPGGVAP